MSVGIHLLSIRLPYELRHLKTIFEWWNVLNFFPYRQTLCLILGEL